MAIRERRARCRRLFSQTRFPSALGVESFGSFDRRRLQLGLRDARLACLLATCGFGGCARPGSCRKTAPSARSALPGLVGRPGQDDHLPLSHTEARYLMPVVPMWLYFVLRAIEAIAGGVRRLWSKSLGWRLALVGMGCLSIASFACTSVEQLRLNEDPFYTADLQRRTVLALLAARGLHGRLRWFGPLATFHPAHRANLKGDDYFDIFHVGADSLEILLGRGRRAAGRDCCARRRRCGPQSPRHLLPQSIDPPEGVPPPPDGTTRVLGPSP